MIDTREILKKAFAKPEVRDYTYAILFLVVSSFFAFFVIRPVLGIAFKLQKEAAELEQINRVYETNINKIVELQKDLIEVRDRGYLMETAVPNGPKLNELLSDIRSAARAAGLSIKTLEVTDVSYIATSKELQTIQTTMRVGGSFSQIDTFIKNLIDQRRLKTIPKIRVSSLSKSKQQSELEVDLEIVGSYFNK